MATSANSTSATQAKSQDFPVHVSREGRKKFHIMKFATSAEVDFTKMKQTSVKLERENNLREYKSAHDIDVAPKYGAGSVFGQEEKEEARRRKYGILRKKYDAEKQPWLMKIGNGKQAKKYKGVREGTVSDNTSYYIFTQKPSGAFEAFPVSEWYTFSQLIKYKYLNSDEAEDEFNKRDKTLNLFNIMLKKRLTISHDEDKSGADKEDGDTVQKGSKKKGKDFLLTEMDDWAMSDEDMGDAEENDEKKNDSDTEVKKSKKDKDKKSKEGIKKRPKNAKQNSDDEAIEESDEGDFDDREVDYMTNSESSDSEPETKVDEEKGVDEEHGLRKLIDSGAESEEDQEQKGADANENENDEDKDNTKDESTKRYSASDSSSSESSDSDLEKDVKSPIFIQKKNLTKKSEKPRSRSSTPQNITDATDKKVSAIKRKSEIPDPSTSKKARSSSPVLSQGASSEAITEDSVRRYLMRKPMTIKDLLTKFKSKKINMPSEQMAATITQILKKIDPVQNVVNKSLYLSLKSTSNVDI